MNRIFINYRREDSEAYAARLYEWLCDRYGQSQVFMDVGTIEPGAAFTDAIARAVQSADVMLVVIGREWIADAVGFRRLDQPDDFVRIEIEAALSSNVRVVPILVGGASLPREDELPGQLVMLNRRQMLELSDTRWRPDLDRLGKVLDVIMGVRPGEEGRGGRQSSGRSVSRLHALAEKLRVRRVN